jgi:hypothetical protein
MAKQLKRDLAQRRKPKRENQHTDHTDRLWIDKRAGALAAAPEDDDALINTSACAEWLSVSTTWLEIGRSKNYGPPFVQLSPGIVRYRKGDVRHWLAQRAFKHTQQYLKPTAAGQAAAHVSKRKATATT